MSVILTEMSLLYTVSPKEVETGEFIDVATTGIAKAPGLTDIRVTDAKSGETKNYAAGEYSVVRVANALNGFTYLFSPSKASRLSPLSPEFKISTMNATGGKRNSKKSRKSRKSKAAKSRKNAGRK
jgi:hypothetical protein